MIATLIALVLSLLIQVQSPNVPVATKIQAIQLAVEIINIAQAEQAIASSTPVLSPAVTLGATTSMPLSQGVSQDDASTTQQNIQQITQIISPPAPVIVPISAPCAIQAIPSPTPHGGPSQYYMAGWDVKLQWDARDAYLIDKNATFTFSPQVTVRYYKSNALDNFGNGTATSHQTATSTTYAVTVNVNNVHVFPQTSCSVTVDLTDSIASTGIPLETIVSASSN